MRRSVRGMPLNRPVNLGLVSYVRQTFSTGFAEAAYRAVTTLALVSPEVIVPRIVEKIAFDLNPEECNALSDDDLGIWSTPEGTTFVDGTYLINATLSSLTIGPVLASKKTEEPQKKGKGYKDAQWEAEVRKSLASKKKAAAPVLSKQDAALVKAQLEKEAIVRRRVGVLKSRIERSFRLTRSLVDTKISEVYSHLSSIVGVLLRGGFGRSSVLTGSAAFETYLVIGFCQPMAIH